MSDTDTICRGQRRTVECALRFYMLVVASLMYRMPAGHKNNGFWGCKEIFATDGAVAFRIALNATMRILK